MAFAKKTSQNCKKNHIAYFLRCNAIGSSGSEKLGMSTLQMIFFKLSHGVVITYVGSGVHFLLKVTVR